MNESVTTCPITVVTGYPGAGKSVLLSLWVASHNAGPVAWWSCDSWDSSPSRFWTSFVTALRTIDPSLGTDALDLFSVGSPSSAEVVGSLVNDINELEATTTLVIDDFNFAPVSATTGFAELIERLPPSLRVVLASRSDPILPLHRWRVLSLVGEIRMADLRLRQEEVAELLREFKVDLPADAVEVLEERTEGWAAGVQLAALSLQSVDDPEAFVRRVLGNESTITDFLMGEALEHQSLQTQQFLLDTSVLEDFDSRQCDELTGRTDSREVLKQLESDSLFLVPLDAERRRYRYHHLFRDLLGAELVARGGGRARELHRRAAEGFEKAGELSNAIRHYAAADDMERAFALLHDHSLDAWFATDGAALEASLAGLPDSLVAAERPRMLDLALASLICGSWSRADMWLDRATRAAPSEDDDFETDSRFLVATALRLALRGEQDLAIPLAQRVLDVGDSSTDSALAALILVRCTLWTDQLDRAMAICRTGFEGPPEPVREAVLLGVEALIDFMQGELAEAEQLAEQALARAEQAGNASHPDLFEALYTQSGIALERCDLALAERCCEEAIRRSEPSRPPPTLLSSVLLASIWAARGDTNGAFAALERARGVLPDNTRSSLTQRVDAEEARLLLLVGRLDHAGAAIERLPAGNARLMREAESALISGDAVQALGILDRVSADPSQTWVVLERAVLHARIVCSLGEDASGAFLRILELGRSGRFVRTVVGTDRDYARCLSQFLFRAPRDSYTDELLAAIDQMQITRSSDRGQGGLLSERERDVLRYLPTRMSYREIASDLYVSMNTLKTHLKSIYRKLDAASRAEACDSARMRGLL